VSVTQVYYPARRPVSTTFGCELAQKPSAGGPTAVAVSHAEIFTNSSVAHEASPLWHETAANMADHPAAQAAGRKADKSVSQYGFQPVSFYDSAAGQSGARVQQAAYVPSPPRVESHQLIPQDGIVVPPDQNRYKDPVYSNPPEAIEGPIDER